MLDWESDPDGWASGLPLRLCGGLHALVRRGDLPGLALLYPPAPLPEEPELWAALIPALDRAAPELAPWLETAPQTNEVGRAAALMAGLLVVAAETGKPIELFELGASAGLNLLLDRYGYDLGGIAAGDLQSPLQLRPPWQGPPPPAAAVRVVARHGVDLRPIDAVADRERLLAYVWPDQPQRLKQLEAAIALSAADPPQLDRGDAADWLDTRLAPTPGVARVVMHSVAYQYFPPEAQDRVKRRIARAGEQASTDAPIAWLRFEKEPDDKQTSLRLTLYPGGDDRLLAWCHPHGSAIVWL